MTTPAANLSTELDYDHPLWYTNAVITGLFDGQGVSEDRETIVKFLVETGLPEGTAHMVYEAIARHHWWGNHEQLTKAITELPAQVQARQDHEFTIQAARSNYAEPSDNDIEIDDTPLLSVADDGVWVSARVWVPIDSDEDEDEAADV